eukprot:4727172-Pleurochrysis_carterae.AAC.2
MLALFEQTREEHTNKRTRKVVRARPYSNTHSRSQARPGTHTQSTHAQCAREREGRGGLGCVRRALSQRMNCARAAREGERDEQRRD